MSIQSSRKYPTTLTAFGRVVSWRPTFADHIEAKFAKHDARARLRYERAITRRR